MSLPPAQQSALDALLLDSSNDVPALTLTLLAPLDGGAGGGGERARAVLEALSTLPHAHGDAGVRVLEELAAELLERLPAVCARGSTYVVQRRDTNCES
jgi:hypothetical protein